MPYFNSSAIRRAEYDSVSSTLTLWFAESGGPYHYYGVPKHVWEALLSASSKGTFLTTISAINMAVSCSLQVISKEAT